MARSQNEAGPARRESSALALLARVYWMLFGIIPVALSALWIAQSEGTPSRADAAFLLSVLALVGVRYLDVAHLAGATAEGEPATIAHWRRYAIGIGGGALALWTVLTAAVRLLFT